MTDTIGNFLGVVDVNDPLPLIERPKYEEKTEADITTARKNLIELIEQGMEQVPSMLDNCSLLQDPKMYAAAAQFMNSLKDMNATLAKINSPLKPKEAPVAAAAPQTIQNTQNNVYVGTTEDFIKRKKQERDSVLIEG